MSKPNNPPAFPYPTYFEGHEPGMTLRDYFAAKAMQALLIAGGAASATMPCKDAYMIADAMLTEREKGGEDAND